MGWLRDLMRSANPPVRSFGELAREALKAPDWPADCEIRERSLATLLSKLDRQEQLQWLADRPSVQRLLSRLLSAPTDALRRPLLAVSPSQAGDTRLLRLRDLPGARPLDLVREPLLPGLPERVQRPDGPALWWVAPSGSGRSLCGAWLKARGRAEFASAERWDGTLALGDGPLFLELGRAGKSEPQPRTGLCVAAPFSPYTRGFEVVRSPPLSETLDLLIDWVAARLPSDTRLAPEPAKKVLQTRLAEGSAQTLADAIGWLGLMDELGAREAAKPVDRIARRFVERRVNAQLDPAATHASWLRRSIYPLLMGLLSRSFTDSDLRLSEARSFEDWMALVPPEVERSVDVEWMRLSLSRIESAIRPSDLDRAARQLPPGAFRVITALEDSGLLARTSTEELRLEPAWLVRALGQQAIQGLIGGSPFEWGEALLRRHAAPAVSRAIFERTLAVGGSALEPVLDLDAEDQPAYAAAVDVAFRAAGIGRLLDADIGQEILDGLLSEMDRLVLSRPQGAPVPRIDLDTGTEDEESEASAEGRMLLTRGSFFLAALSVTEVGSKSVVRLGPLNPWRQTSPSPALASAYDEIFRSLETAPRWEHATCSLVGRIRRAIGNVSDPEVPHPLEQPAQVLDEAELGVLSWSTVRAHGESRPFLPSLLALAAERHVPLATLLPAIWAAWDEAERPENAAFLAPSAPEHRQFWAMIPEGLLAKLLVDDRRTHVPYPVFGAEQWRAFSRALVVYPELVRDSGAWEFIPEELAFTLLGSELPWQTAPAALRMLWKRFPERLLAVVRQKLQSAQVSDREPLGLLLEAIPPDSARVLLESLKSEPVPGIGPYSLDPLRALLHRLVGERAPAWREAYGMLAQLERELRRVTAQ